MVNKNIKSRFKIKQETSIIVKKKISKKIDIINKITNLLIKTVKNKKKILFCGNGGSASDAQHAATELLIRFDKKYKRKSLAAICLSSDMSLLTACANDFSFNKIFSRPFSSLAENGDLLFCLSTSGNSKNIIDVLKTAKKKNINSVAFLGKGGGEAKTIADYKIIVPSFNTAIIQETHMFLIHLILEHLEENI